MRVSVRLINFCGFSLCLILLGMAAYLQVYLKIEPCPLCVIQRFIFLLLGLLFLLSTIVAAKRTWVQSLAILTFSIAAAGLAVAGKQVWLQHLPIDQVPACGPGFDYMLREFPVTKILHMLLMGSGECAEIQWTFLQLSIAEWSLISLLVLALLAISTFLRELKGEKS